MSDPSYPGAQSVSRAVGLLKLFSDAQPAWSLANFVQATDLNKTTVYRLLSALESEGLVARADDGCYRLGPEMIALGGCAMRTNDLRSVARPRLEQVAESTGEAATLEVLVGALVTGQAQMLVLDEVVSSYLVGMSQDVGARLPLHATSTGLLLLAFQPENAIAQWMESPREKITPQTQVNTSALTKTLQTIRQRGFATTVGELEIGFNAVAAPVLDHAGAVVAAMSVGGPSARLDETRLVEIAAVLQEATRHVSRQLGYRSPK